MPVVNDRLQCYKCKQEVSGYDHRTSFAFVDGERIVVGHSAILSCGCEVLEYDIDIDETLPSRPTKLIDTLRKTVVLEFYDGGDHNNLWYGEEDE